MNDALLVRRREHVEHLVGDEQDLLDDQRARFALEAVRERLAVEQLHHQEHRAVFGGVVVAHLDRAGVLDLVGELAPP